MKINIFKYLSGFIFLFICTQCSFNHKKEDCVYPTELKKYKERLLLEWDELSYLYEGKTIQDIISIYGEPNEYYEYLLKKNEYYTPFITDLPVYSSGKDSTMVRDLRWTWEQDTAKFRVWFIPLDTGWIAVDALLYHYLAVQF